jgi:GDP-L-fucose synthase
MPLPLDSRVYVAGHTGLIGSALVRALCAAGVEPIVHSHDELDLGDATAVERFFDHERPEYVLLAAGRVGGIVVNRDFPAQFITENLAIQLNSICAAHRTGVRRLILFASSCMYPREASQPMGEVLLLTGRPEPTSMAYAIAKLAGVEMCLAYNRQYGGQRFVPIIPNSVYGPNDNFDPAAGHVLSALIRRFHEAKLGGARSVTLWGSGSPCREFLYADDLAAACLKLLTADLSATELPLNIGPGEDISIRELGTLVARVVGYDGQIAWDTSKPDGAPRKLLDSARSRALGWKPSTPLERGVRCTYDWYRERLLEKAAT